MDFFKFLSKPLDPMSSNEADSMQFQHHTIDYKKNIDDLIDQSNKEKEGGLLGFLPNYDPVLAKAAEEPNAKFGSNLINIVRNWRNNRGKETPQGPKFLGLAPMDEVERQMDPSKTIY